MTAHKRFCGGYSDSDSEEEGYEEDDDEENEDNYVDVEFIGDDEVYEVVYL